MRKEPPVYGRIRRRKSSLPANTGTFKGPVSSLNTLTRYPRLANPHVRERAVDVEFKTTTRHLRDPVPDTPYHSSTLPLTDMRTDSHRDAIYAKVPRKTSKRYQSHDNKTDAKDAADGRLEADVTGHKTMSRRRIIENMKDRNVYEDQNSSRTEDSADIQSEFQSESQSGQSRDFDLHGDRDLEELEADRSKETKSRSDIRDDWPKTKHRSKSQSRLIENFRSTHREIGAATRLVTTLPSYVKSSRKCSTEKPPGIDCHRKLTKETGISSKQSKERSNYVKKSATSHVKACNDVSGGRSNSPVTTSSIFGFCTGKRKVQSSPQGTTKVEGTPSYPSWNVKTVSIVFG